MSAGETEESIFAEVVFELALKDMEHFTRGRVGVLSRKKCVS